MLNSLTPDMYTVFYYRSTETFGFFLQKTDTCWTKKVCRNEIIEQYEDYTAEMSWMA